MSPRPSALRSPSVPSFPSASLSLSVLSKPYLKEYPLPQVRSCLFQKEHLLRMER
jgi:hypothetical protein